MNTRKSDIAINNALALMATLPATPSVKAQKQAALFLSGKKEARVPTSGASDADRLLLRLVSLNPRAFSDFDSAALVKLHFALFEGIRPDAGKLRTQPLEAGGSGFADPSLISGSLKRLLGKLHEPGALPESSKENFAMNITYYLTELFLLCPFRSGSLLTLAAFLGMFASSKGYRLDYFKCGGARLSDAVMTAFVTDEKSELFVALSEAVGYENISADGEEVPVVDATQIKRELRHDSRPKTLVKRGARVRAESPKKEPRPKKEAPRKEAKPRPNVKETTTKKQAAQAKKQTPTQKKPPAKPTANAQKTSTAVSVREEMSAAKAAIAAEMKAAKEAIAAEAEAARAAIEAEKAAARAEMERKALEEKQKSLDEKQKAEAKKSRSDSGKSRSKSSLKKALARTVLLFEDMPEFGDMQFEPEPPKKENPLLLPSSGANLFSDAASATIDTENKTPIDAKDSAADAVSDRPVGAATTNTASERHDGAAETIGAVTDKVATETEVRKEERPTQSSEAAPLPKLAPIKKIERMPVEEKVAPERKADESEKRVSIKPVASDISKAAKQVDEQKAVAEKQADEQKTAAENEEDRLARKVADISKLPSSVLKKAARIKEQIELLQKELDDVLDEKNDKKPEDK